MTNKEKIAKHAKDLSETIFELAYESESFHSSNEDSYGREITGDFIDKIMEIPLHKEIMLNLMSTQMAIDIHANPHLFKTDGDFRYQTDDLVYEDMLSEYIAEQFEKEHPYIDVFQIGARLTTNGLNMLEVLAVSDSQVSFRNLVNNDLELLGRTEHDFKEITVKTLFINVLTESIKSELGETDAVKDHYATMHHYFETFL